MSDITEALKAHQLWLEAEGGERADLSGADLVGANLIRENLSMARLGDADLNRANMMGANLTGADLGGANLIAASLRDANLSGANLIGANLTVANLMGASLRDANLSGANLIGANLSVANMTGRTPLWADATRGYVLYVLPEVAGGPRFVAGCRNFAATEAVHHWTTVSVQPEYVAAIEKWCADHDVEVNEEALAEDE